MAAASSLLAHIHRLLDPSAAELGSDAELLQRFVCTHDQAAFSALVGRHGPMVLRLCRRVLGDVHAAEDACQAVFLVLARKAERIRHPETLSCWLHGVAYRIALKVRAAEVRRRQVETQCQNFAPSPSTPDPLAEVSAREFLAILDAELQRLPERYRLPLILCCLEGRSQPEAARLLGWTAGSVKGRLERGRAKLHQRLLRRGLTLQAVLLALEATRDAASAHLPALLSAALLRAASTGGVSTAVMALAEGSLSGMASVKLKLVSALVLILGLVAGGFGALAYPQLEAPQEAENQTTESKTPAKEPAHPRTSKEKRPALRDRYGDPLPSGALARLGTVRLRPGHSVHLLAFLSDRKSFLSVATEDELMVVSAWQMNSGKLLHRFHAPGILLGRGCEVALSPDGKTLAVCSYNRADEAFRVLFWDVASGKTTGELREAGGRILALAFSPDGKTLATSGEDQTLHLWDVATRTELRRFEEVKDKRWHLAFSADGKFLVAIGQEHTIQLWEAGTGKLRKILKLGPGAEQAVAFSPDGRTVATSGTDGKKVRLWDVAEGKVVRELPAEIATAALAFSPDGKMLATGEARQESKTLERSAIHLWEISTGRELHRLPGHFFGVSTLAFSPDGKQLLSGSVGGTLHLWETASGKDLLPFAEHESYVTSIAFSPDGRSLATGGLDGTIRLWEPAAGKPARLFERKHQQRVWRIAFVPDGRTLLSYGHDESIRFWDVAQGRQTRQWAVTENRSAGIIAFSPDGRTFAVPYKGGSIGLFDADTGKEQRRLAVAKGDGSFPVYSPDGKSLASVSSSRGAGSGVLQLWDTTTGKELRKWMINQSGIIAFSADSRTIFGFDSGFFPRARVEQRTFQEWDVGTGENHSFQAVQRARIFCAAVSPDGRTLAWGDTEGTITLWERAARQVRRRLKGHLSYVEALIFSPDGKSLASGSADTTALLWDVTGMLPDSLPLPLSDERLKANWADLASNDAAKAFDAIGLLTAAPEQAIPLLKSKLHPALESVEPKQLARLIAHLNSDEFAVREKAQEQLRQFGERAEPGLREALKDRLTLEMRRRIEEILEGVRTAAAAPENLRNLRAVEVLEYIGTTEAREVLKTLANGASSARLTREAKASLERLARRHNPKP